MFARVTTVQRSPNRMDEGIYYFHWCNLTNGKRQLILNYQEEKGSDKTAQA